VERLTTLSVCFNGFTEDVQVELVVTAPDGTESTHQLEKQRNTWPWNFETALDTALGT
jgi:hypothetical protein